MQITTLQENIDILERYKPLAPNYFALLTAILGNRSVDQALAEFGLIDAYSSHGKRYNFSRADKENMLEMHNEGMSYQRIAEQYGCSWQTVREYVMRLRQETGTIRKKRKRRANRKKVIDELIKAVLHNVLEKGESITNTVEQAKELMMWVYPGNCVNK